MGRPKKETYESDDDHLADIFAQLFDAEYDDNGELKYVRSGRRLTLEDMAFLTWYQDGCPSKGPITKVGQEKREYKVVQKIKCKLLQLGYSLNDLRDMITTMSKAQRREACYDKLNDSID